MKIALYANTDWYLYNFRCALASHLRDQGHTLILLSPAGEYGQQLRELGFDWRPIPMNRRSLNPWSEFRLLIFLYRLLRDEHIDIVHGFTIKPAVYAGLAGRLAGLSGRIGAVAGLGYVFTSEDARARLLRPLVSVAMRVAFAGDSARLIVQNPDDLEVFERQQLVRASHIRLIKGSGVDCQVFSAGEGSADESSPLKILFAARILWDKGIGEFVEAAQILRRNQSAHTFLVAGEPDEGNPSAVPRQTIVQWQLDGDVTWLGHVQDMPALYQSVDIVVLPSYREGLPKGLIEAAACGLPIVTTAVPGCTEVVSHKKNGLVVPVRDVAGLVAAIEELAENSELRAALGQAARKKVLAEFEQGIVIQQTMAVYAELLPPVFLE